ncbi:uncharacterized protein N7446_010753 [Penicillium canescens]|uniref:Uncharacterized protein n=1 Tax=Penicillium canescens TaxID=5083 RepID=A0AAD6N8D3_PENCN|nr:uncharacterized protein N7446_010753 [Penicillium canescens]KAJ6041356.1 hypothetical protein N7460_006746 [Penicillium canescens]KAJ6050644.1 hypothetical protein N7446_010753 [Penicillium canescens]
MLGSLPKALRAIIAIFIILVLIQSLLILTDGPTVAYLPSHHGVQADVDAVDWSRFAYTQYVTNTAYLCNSVMLFETLHRLNSKPDRVMMYPSEFSLDENDAEPNLDELFFMPPCPLGLPRAYWLNPDERVQGTGLLLIQPSHFEFRRVMAAINNASGSEYDMEIVNTLYKDSALIIPHRPYMILTGEFRGEIHTKYLGNDQEVWNPDKVLREAKFLHFSDWPVPKPWIRAPQEVMDHERPRCRSNATSGHKDDCRDRDYWLGFYADFSRRRADVCGEDV